MCPVLGMPLPDSFEAMQLATRCSSQFTWQNQLHKGQLCHHILTAVLARLVLAVLACFACPADLAKWLPGRSADALRQAYAHNIAGNEAIFLAKLTANNWPSDVAALLAAWPGPTGQVQVRAEAHMLLAAN